MTIAEENDPRTSNVFAMSETSRCFVTFVRGGKSVMVSQKWSKLVFHSIPSILMRFNISDGVHGLRMFGLWKNLLKYRSMLRGSGKFFCVDCFECPREVS